MRAILLLFPIGIMIGSLLGTFMILNSPLVFQSLFSSSSVLVLGEDGMIYNKDNQNNINNNQQLAAVAPSSALDNLHDGIDDEPCETEMRRIFQRNECLRSYEYNKNRKSKESSTSSSSCDVAAPLHLWARYYGQGFGRQLHHSVETCIFASVIERPCVIDLDVRDKYYTWRSFINVGKYNWDWKIVSDRYKNINDAYNRLEQKKDDEWKGDSVKTLPNYDDVLPMVWHADWDNATDKHLELWHGNNAENRHKVLLSPSFGLAWHRQKRYRTEIERHVPGCTMNQMRTSLQNAMYEPTALAMELFQERKIPFMGKEQSTYGAIHLRTIKGDLSKSHYDNDETVALLRRCLRRVAREIDTWWLVSDNITAAEYIEKRIDYIRTDYNSSESAIMRKTKNNVNFHSGHQTQQKFSQQHMAPSIEDFMILHESTVAVVTHGEFGYSGARGNGKIQVDKCGPEKTFKIFRKPTRK